MLSKQDKKIFLEKLIQFLKIRSISSDAKYHGEMLRAVDFLREELTSIGFAKDKIKKFYAKSPVVYAEKLDNPQAPTVLIYGHYDVQPPEPLELWKTPPFEASVRRGKIFARGATDDKGQVYTHLAALKLLAREWGSVWPINIKILIEGEEESGGKNIERLISENPDKFRADICLVSDTGFISKSEPAIEVGLRGIAYFELEVITAKEDLHSGLFGGAACNPFNLLTSLLAGMQAEFGSGKLRKEPLNASYPSFDIHGILGGFQGEGSKTVIPNKAAAKFSIRIVPGQNPREVTKLVSNFIRKRVPKGVKINLKILGVGEAFLVRGESRYLKLAQKSMKKVFGQNPRLTRSSGSIPIVSTIAKKLNAEVILMGYGLPDDNLHAPNEKFDLDQFYKGIECNVEFYKRLVSSIK